MPGMSAPIARAARLSRAYSSAAAAAAAQQPQSVACFGPLYTEQVKSSLSPFTTTSDALARQTLRNPLPSAAFSAIYTQTLTGPLHKRVVAAGPTVSEPLPAGTDKGTCK